MALVDVEGVFDRARSGAPRRDFPIGVGADGGVGRCRGTVRMGRARLNSSRRPNNKR
jgi:hypothetical protein